VAPGISYGPAQFGEAFQPVAQFDQRFTNITIIQYWRRRFWKSLSHEFNPREKISHRLRLNESLQSGGERGFGQNPRCLLSDLGSSRRVRAVFADRQLVVHHSLNDLHALRLHVPFHFGRFANSMSEKINPPFTSEERRV